MSDSATNNLTVTIRPMEADDLTVIMRLERNIFPDPWPVSAFEDIFKIDGWNGFVAESDDVVVGYACMLVIAGECHLANIAVVPEFRRKSVANQLLEHILEVAQQMECDSVLLEVRVSNQVAIAFYEKNKFAQTNVRKGYYHDPKEDAAVMIRRLP